MARIRSRNAAVPVAEMNRGEAPAATAMINVEPMTATRIPGKRVSRSGARSRERARRPASGIVPQPIRPVDPVATRPP